MRRTRLIVLLALLPFFAGTAYMVSPLMTAWALRDAVQSRDSAYLARKIDWVRVKATLRPSLGRIAFNIPDPIEDPAPRGVWQRIKDRLGRSAIDRMVDSYVTPEGLPKLLAYRNTYRGTFAEPEEVRTLTTLPERLVRFWSRVQRAEFKSLTRFELDILDKHVADRQYTSVLEFSDFQWKLVELHVQQLTAPSLIVDASR